MYELNDKINKDIYSLYSKYDFFKLLWREFFLRHFANHFINNNSCKELEAIKMSLRESDADIDCSMILKVSSWCDKEESYSEFPDILEHMIKPELHQNALIKHSGDKNIKLNEEIYQIKEKFKDTNRIFNDIKKELLSSFKRLGVGQSGDQELEHILAAYIQSTESLHKNLERKKNEYEAFMKSNSDKVNQLELNLAEQQHQIQE